jgi:hypothetical protein
MSGKNEGASGFPEVEAHVLVGFVAGLVVFGGKQIGFNFDNRLLLCRTAISERAPCLTSSRKGVAFSRFFRLTG